MIALRYRSVLSTQGSCDTKGGKSELHRARWSLTATGGDPKESATENKPPETQGIAPKALVQQRRSLCRLLVRR